jgi:hypothetical protein
VQCKYFCSNSCTAIACLVCEYVQLYPTVCRFQEPMQGAGGRVSRTGFAADFGGGVQMSSWRTKGEVRVGVRVGYEEARYRQG